MLICSSWSNYHGSLINREYFESKAQTLVNTVNCVCIMGKGLALEFKELFPDMYEDYVARCKAHQVKLGEPYLYRGLFPRWVLNFPTKDHWRSVSRLSDIVAGLEYLEKHYREWENPLINPLGAASPVTKPRFWYAGLLDVTNPIQQVSIVSETAKLT